MPDKEEKLDESFWEESDFTESLGPVNEEKMKTFHMKHDEDMGFACKKCEKKISAHNKDWHAGLCDRCFDNEVYPGNHEL